MNDKNLTDAVYQPSLICFLVARICAATANQLIAIAIGWQIYTITQSALYLGLVGLMQFIPLILFTLFAGYAADRFNRKWIVSIAFCIQICNFMLLAYLSFQGAVSAHMLLIAAFLAGTANSMGGPSMQSLLPHIVPAEISRKQQRGMHPDFRLLQSSVPRSGGCFMRSARMLFMQRQAALLWLHCVR